ncbi:MAG: PAAR-like protein [Chlamydiales bacterium]
MPNLVCDGAEFSCMFCTSKLKLTVTSSSTTGDSKKLANQGNCFLPPPPGGNCTFPPGVPPSPCPGVPPGCVISAGQSTVKIDNLTALGDGCKFMCPKAQVVSLSNAGQTVVKHDEAD